MTKTPPNRLENKLRYLKKQHFILLQSCLCITINCNQIKRCGEKMNLGNQDPKPQVNFQAQPNFAGPSHQGIQNKPSKSRSLKKLDMKFLTVVLVVLVGVLVALIIAALLFYKTNTENGYVNTSTYQSVDINVNGSTGGQIYFGKIVIMNSSYVVMDNVFYLEPGTSSNQFSLNSLTCTLYNPQNQIVINRSQIAFWENLSAKSQVVADINKWQTDKLQCASNSSATTSSSTSSTTPSTSSTTPSTSSTTPSTTK